MFWKLIAKICAKPAVAQWLINRAFKTPYSHITGPDGSIYMGRWWLFNAYPAPGEYKGKWQFPISIRIHHIQRADSDRNLHDHPWNARTIIIGGGYVEKRLRVIDRDSDSQIDWGTDPVHSAHIRRVGDTAALKFGEYHSITDVTPGGAWTIFITGKYRGTWGFLVDGVKVPWWKYLNIE